MACPVYMNIRNALLDNDEQKVQCLLKDIPRDSLVDVWNSVISLMYLADRYFCVNIRSLLKMFLDVNMRFDDLDSHGNTPLMHAARHGLTYVCGALICAGADVNCNDPGLPYSALSLALQQTHWAVVHLLQTHGARLGGARHRWDASIFRTAIEKDDPQVMTFLCDQFKSSCEEFQSKDLMLMCRDNSATDCAQCILKFDFEQQKKTVKDFCPYTWSLQWFISIGCDPAIDAFATDNFSEFDPRIRVLSVTFETLLHHVVHNCPLSLITLTKATILKHLGYQAPVQIPNLPLPNKTKLSLMESEIKPFRLLSNETVKRAKDMVLPRCVLYLIINRHLLVRKFGSLH